MEKLNFDELQPSAFEAIVGGASDAKMQGAAGSSNCCNVVVTIPVDGEQPED